MDSKRFVSLRCPTRAVPGRSYALPEEIFFMIATMLSTGQVLKLGRASIYVYNAVSVVLHREIILNEIRSHSCLSYMVRRIRNPKTVFRTRAASASVRKLSYLVDSPDVVIQDLPPADVPVLH